MAKWADIDQMRSPGRREDLCALKRDNLVVTAGEDHGGKGQRPQQHRAEAAGGIVLQAVAITGSHQEGASYRLVFAACAQRMTREVPRLWAISSTGFVQRSTASDKRRAQSA